MTRVLYIGSGKPWLGGAGFLVRQQLFLHALADAVTDAGGELHLAMFDAADAAPPPYAASLTPLPLPRRLRPPRVLDILADVTSPKSRLERAFDATAPRAAVQALRPESFDVCFAFRIDFAHHAGVLGHPRLVLDVDDPEHTRWARRAAATPYGADWRSRRDVDKLKAFEHAAEGHAKLAFVCQDNDARGWPVPPEVVPNTVDLPATVCRRATRPVVLFVGNCGGSDVTPNVDAVRHFLADCWPAVRAAVPDAEFQLVGSAGAAAKAAVAAAPGAVYRGFVDNLADAYAEAAVAVAPIRFGTGTRVKILDAFAHGCPVLSTAVGAEGIAAVPGKEIELAVGPADFADRCVALLKGRDAAERIGAAGRSLAERCYDAAVQRRQVADRLSAFLHAGQPPAVAR